MLEKLGTCLIVVFLISQNLIQIIYCRNPRQAPDITNSTLNITTLAPEITTLEITSAPEQEAQTTITATTEIPESVQSTTDIEITTQSIDLNCLKVFGISANAKACLVQYSMNYTFAYNYCKEKNTRLLEVHSDDEKKILFKVAQEYFGTGGGTTIWIDGKWMYDSNQYRLYESNKSFYLSQKIKSPLEKFSGKDDYCLSVQSYFKGQYEISPIRCEHYCYFFCEF